MGIDIVVFQVAVQWPSVSFDLLPPTASDALPVVNEPSPLPPQVFSATSFAEALPGMARPAPRPMTPACNHYSDSSNSWSFARIPQDDPEQLGACPAPAGPPSRATTWPAWT